MDRKAGDSAAPAQGVVPIILPQLLVVAVVS